MTAVNILDYEPVNPTYPEHVQEIKESIIVNGWMGCPILCYGNLLLTGSHRQAALRELAAEDYNIKFDCAVDVTDLIDGIMQANGWTLEDIYNNLDCLRCIFTGTWVEEYKEQLADW
jgi:hypothetical protein